MALYSVVCSFTVHFFFFFFVLLGPVKVLWQINFISYANNLPVCHSISSFDCALEMACSISRSGTAF